MELTYNALSTDQKIEVYRCSLGSFWHIDRLRERLESLGLLLDARDAERLCADCVGKSTR